MIRFATFFPDKQSQNKWRDKKGKWLISTQQSLSVPLTAAAAEAAAIALFGPGISGDNRNSLGEQTPETRVCDTHTHTRVAVFALQICPVWLALFSPLLLQFEYADLVCWRPNQATSRWAHTHSRDNRDHCSDSLTVTFFWRMPPCVLQDWRGLLAPDTLAHSSDTAIATTTDTVSALEMAIIAA